MLKSESKAKEIYIYIIQTENATTIEQVRKHTTAL